MYTLPIEYKSSLLTGSSRNSNLVSVIADKNKEFDLNIEVAITSGGVSTIDIAKAPHLLIAGTTGSGKSVFLNVVISSLIMKNSPWEVEFIMIDPKRVELSTYADIPHLICPIIHQQNDAVKALKWLCKEMDSRYDMLNQYKVKSVDALRSIYQVKLSTMVCVIDEFSQLMLGACRKEIEQSLVSLAQMGRAAGIHIIIATQSPRANVISGLIKANFPSVVAFKVASKLESRIVLDKTGAENLKGNGDMIVALASGDNQRIQSVMVEEEQIFNIVNFVKSQYSANYYRDVLAESIAAAEIQNESPVQGLEYLESYLDGNENIFASKQNSSGQYLDLLNQAEMGLENYGKTPSNSSGYLEVAAPKSDSEILAEAIEWFAYTPEVSITDICNRFYISFDKAEQVAKRLIARKLAFRESGFYSSKVSVTGTKISWQ